MRFPDVLNNETLPDYRTLDESKAQNKKKQKGGIFG